MLPTEYEVISYEGVRCRIGTNRYMTRILRGSGWWSNERVQTQQIIDAIHDLHNISYEYLFFMQLNTSDVCKISIT